MPSSVSQRMSRAFSISSYSSSKSSSSTDSSNSDTKSFNSDTQTLLIDEFPNPQCPSRMDVMKEGNAMLDPEDQAWGSPPTMQIPWPAFLQRRKSGRKSARKSSS